MVQQASAEPQLWHFARATGWPSDFSQPDFHRWSVDHFRTFWAHVLDWSGLRYSGSPFLVCDGDDVEHARFFPDLSLNYAFNLLSQLDERDALVSLGDAGTVRLSGYALRENVERLAGGLCELGLEPGDHVAAVLANNADAIVVALAVAALGAVLATGAPDSGLEGLVSRFAEITPRFLIVACPLSGPSDGSSEQSDQILQIAQALPSLAAVIGSVGASAGAGFSCRYHRIERLLASRSLPIAEWPEFPFNHPLFILFSSGTTGRPKCIVHGAGGTLLEHIKEHRLHCDLQRGDRLFFYTSSAWMMWHWQLSALASGVTLILYDGPIASPSTLWQIVADQNATVFGTSPPYLQMCMAAGARPSEHCNLAALRAVLSTGAILYPHQSQWVRDKVKPVPVQSISGGSDIIGCFVLGAPLLPLVDGESQSLSLGMDVRALSSSGADAIGELVCANPFPSRPLKFLNDPDGERLHASYYESNPGFWTHGDLIELTASGGARIHGRSDGLINVRGIRIGPAEIYRILLGAFPEVRDVMAVVQQQSSATDSDRLILFVVMIEQRPLTDWLSSKIRSRLRVASTAAHVPDLMLAVDALPMTANGKRSEAAMSDAINQRPVRNLKALANPESLAVARDHPALQPLPQASRHAARLTQPDDLSSVQIYLQSLWQTLFDKPSIGLDDNFFDFGGNSLLAATMFADIFHETGREFPLSTLLVAPTIAALAMVVQAAAPSANAQLVKLKNGTGSPLFLIHSLAGTTFELWALCAQLDINRPVFGIQARGLDEACEPHRGLQEMARDYVALIQQIQPRGPYELGGYSFGGLVAFEMAQQLTANGNAVGTVLLIDTLVDPQLLPLTQRLRRFCHGSIRLIRRELRDRKRGIRLPAESKRARSWSRVAFEIRSMAHAIVDRRQGAAFSSAPPGLPLPLARTRIGLEAAMRGYKPKPYSGELIYVRASRKGPVNAEPIWRHLASGGIKVRTVRGSHDTIITHHVAELSQILSADLRTVAEPGPAYAN